MEESGKKGNPENASRRTFLKTVGAATAGLIVAPYVTRSSVFAFGRADETFVSRVAITQADKYDRAFVKQKVQYLFDSLGGITDVVKAGSKVAVKINLTGGGGMPDNMWTHPEVLRAVGELIIDCGVDAKDLYIVESLWSDNSYYGNGYSDVQKSLGANFVDLNKPAPYDDFVKKPVGPYSFNFSSLTVNRLLTEVDVYVSIPKMKQHYEAGVTCSLKNQVGMVPKNSYTITYDDGRRGALHHAASSDPSTGHLPRSICDLNLARPVNLAVIDGIKNARGGEGTWNPTFKPCEDHILLAGKDPVATDSVAAYFMGNDPEADTFELPGGGRCDNYLSLLHGLGIGTNRMHEIEVVGDGASLITPVRPKYEVTIPEGFQLFQNYPNPFNPSTMINYQLQTNSHVTLKIYDVIGREVATLVDGNEIAGSHLVRFDAGGLSSGVYLCRMAAAGFSRSMKMIYQK